jgi:hypothetical protein
LTVTPADAWADFVGWRVIYEQAAYALALAVDAAPALWSGLVRHGLSAIPPIRPPLGRQDKMVAMRDALPGRPDHLSVARPGGSGHQ